MAGSVRLCVLCDKPIHGRVLSLAGWGPAHADPTECGPCALCLKPVSEGRLTEGGYVHVHDGPKLSTDDQLDIIEAYQSGGVDMKELAERYGVSKSLISHVTRRAGIVGWNVRAHAELQRRRQARPSS